MLILKEMLQVIFEIKIVSKGTSLVDHEHVDLCLYLQLWSIYCLLNHEKNHVLKKKSKNKDTYPDHLGIKYNNCKIQNYCGKVHQIKVQKMEISNVKKNIILSVFWDSKTIRFSRQARLWLRPI